jgi:hypothetical protein
MGAMRQATKFMLMESGESAWFPDALDLVAGGKSISEICKAQGLAISTVMSWIDAVPARVAAYERAKRIWADIAVQECTPISDEATPETVQVGRLRVETRMKVAGMYDRDRFGQKQATAVTNNTVILSDSTAAAAAALLKRMAPAIEVDVTPGEHAV